MQDQITGFYEQIRDAIASQEYSEAQRLIEQVRTYLEQPAVLALPAVQERRDAELFVLESLSRLVTPQASAETEDPGDGIVERAERYDTVVSLIDRAEQARSRGNQQEAVTTFREALSEIPGGLDGHESVLSRAEEEWQATEQVLTERITELNSEVDNAEAEIVRLETEESETREQLQGEIEEMAAQLSDLRNERDRRERELDALEAQRDALAGELARTQEELEEATAEAGNGSPELDQQAEERIAELEEEIARLEEEAAGAESLAREVERLEEVERDLNQVQQAYLRFRERESEVVDSDDPTSLIEGKLLLDEFLATPGVQDILPDIDERLRRYDRAFQQSGERAAMLEIVDVVQSLSGYQSTDARIDFIESELSRSSNPQMTEFLSELEGIVSN